MKKIYLTQTGLEKLQQEHQQLSADRKAAVDDLKTAREMGDLSENAAYKVARFRLSSLDRRLRFLNRVLSQAEVQVKRSDGRIGIGSQVELEANGKIIRYEIVGSLESDLAAGKLSASSPVGRQLLGRREQEEITVLVPQGKMTYKIIAIS